MKKTGIVFALSCTLILLLVNSCENKMDKQTKINKELSIIDSLIRDTLYALQMAQRLNSAYYTGIGEQPPPFLKEGEDTAATTTKISDEKVATNLAGFYALECAIGALCEDDDSTPVYWLNKIVSGGINEKEILLLNRFANATWKASQPFRDLKRIKKDNFIVASALSDEEVEKDAAQIKSAAGKLLASLDGVKDQSKDGQLKKIRDLLHDKNYAIEMAEFLDASYYTSQNQTPPLFLSTADDSTVVTKHAKDQKIATNLAGFYALECGLNYFVTVRNEVPSDILKSILNDQINAKDKLLLSRFANATWKTGQPFRGLDRITRATFTPFYFLTKEDIDKDYVQIKAAAKKLLESL